MKAKKKMEEPLGNEQARKDLEFLAKHDRLQLSFQPRSFSLKIVELGRNGNLPIVNQIPCKNWETIEENAFPISKMKLNLTNTTIEKDLLVLEMEPFENKESKKKKQVLMYNGWGANISDIELQAFVGNGEKTRIRLYGKNSFKFN